MAFNSVLGVRSKSKMGVVASLCMTAVHGVASFMCTGVVFDVALNTAAGVLVAAIVDVAISSIGVFSVVSVKVDIFFVVECVCVFLQV